MIKNKLYVVVGAFLLFVALSLNAAHPIVPDLSGDHSELRTDFNSKLWNDAAVVDKFKSPLDYKTLKLADEQTEVRILADSKNLYFLVKAFDKNLKKAKVESPSVDKYLNKFPIGDHVELQFSAGVKKILAVDMNGNKFSSTTYKPDKYCDYDLVTRKTDKGWEAIVTIKISSLKLSKRSKTRNFQFQVVRHLDHGEGAIRSFAKGESMVRYIIFSISAEQINKKVK